MDIKEAIRQELDALNRHDTDGVMAFYTDEVIFNDISLAEPLKGADAMRSYMQEFFDAFEDLHIDVISLFGEKDVAAAEYELSGTNTGALEGQPATGKTFRLRAVSTYYYDGSLFTEETFYWDSASMMAQLGLS